MHFEVLFDTTTFQRMEGRLVVLAEAKEDFFLEAQAKRREDALSCHHLGFDGNDHFQLSLGLATT